MRHSSAAFARGHSRRKGGGGPGTVPSSPHARERRPSSNCGLVAGDDRPLYHRHHRVGLLVVDDVGDRQHDHDAPFVLPPMLETVGLARDFAGLVQDRHCAFAAVFEDLAWLTMISAGRSACEFSGTTPPGWISIWR